MKKKPTKKKPAAAARKAVAPAPPKPSATEQVETALAAVIASARLNPTMPAAILAKQVLNQYQAIHQAVNAQILLTRMTYGLAGFLPEADAYLTKCGALPEHLDPLAPMRKPAGKK